MGITFSDLLFFNFRLERYSQTIKRRKAKGRRHFGNRYCKCHLTSSQKDSATMEMHKGKIKCLTFSLLPCGAL